MDETVIKFYRKLLKAGFEYAGSFENASIFLDTTGEKVSICGAAGDFIQLYVNVTDNTIDDIRYLCVCDPTANVAVEILCALVKGRTLDEAASLTEQAFSQFLGNTGEEMEKKANGLLKLLNLGITRYKAQV